MSEQLNYVLVAPRAPITLNLFEAERYESAVVVQPLIGNLVYYSNRGRYEPKLARTWSRTSPTTWRFNLHDNLHCENGEPITASSFRDSIVRSLRYLTKKADFPIFNQLKGFDQFRNGGELPGIIAEGNDLVFEFVQPTRSGLLQLLSFAPFGYICAGNFSADGKWKSDSSFISSGPFRVKSIKIGDEYILERNPRWSIGFGEGAPREIRFSHKIPIEPVSTSPWIIDSFSPVSNLPRGFSEYRLVPEYINPVLIGNLDRGYFSNKENRENFRNLLESHREALPERWDGHTRSNAFYPNQDTGTLRTRQGLGNFSSLSGTVKIGGDEPTVSSPKFTAWKILKASLDEAGLKYEFVGEKTSMASLTNRDIDLRMVGGSIGGGVEPWGISILFCSDLGPKFPDPTERICKLVKDYENDRIDDKAFSTEFFKIVDEDAAIVPVSHYGIQLYLSSSIATESISPLMSVMRFEDLELK